MTKSVYKTRTARRIAGLFSTFALAFTTAFQPLALTTASAQLTQEKAPNNYIKITSENASIPKLVRLGLNKSIVVDLPAVANDVLVANPEVADAVMRTSQRIYLFGKKQGQTNIFVFDNTGKQIAAIEILIERDIAGLESSLARFIPNSAVKAEMINGSVVLTGTVATPADAAKAVSLATVFVNNIESAGSFFTRITDKDIVNLIKIQGEDQVQLKVIIAEIQRAVVKQLGINTGIINGDINNPATDGFAFQALGFGSMSQNAAAIGSGISGSIIHGQNSLTSQIQALEKAGVIRMLSEPNLTAVSGEAATFEVGGTWQVPTNIDQDDTGAVRVTYEDRPYGLTLNFTPVVLTEGRISLRLSTEVEEPTPINSASIGQLGGTPATRRRAATTSVELPSGGSMAIAGLVQDDIRQAISGTPGLANIPILGSLFRSREFMRNETELVIIVTPYLVRPTALSNLVRPDENFAPASDSAGMFMGRVNRVYGTKQGNLPEARYTGTVGFIFK